MVVRGQREKEEVTINRYVLSFGDDGNVLEWIVVMVVQQCEYTETH